MRYQEGNFFSIYPELAYKLPFRELKEKFSEKEASELCWYVTLYCDEKSEFRKYPAKVRQEQLEDFFLKRKVHDIPEVQKAISTYDEHMMSLAKRNFLRWEEKLTERQQFIEETPYDEFTYKMLDALMKDTDKMWKMYLTLKAEMEKEDDEGKVFGGAELSDAEKGDI